jgi:hypothetical protein
MNREVHVRICGRLGAKFPGPTRQEETEPRQTGLRRPGENLTHRHREANVTAPLLDSTQSSRWKEFGAMLILLIVLSGVDGLLK